jgi:hypothetical protein
VIQKIELSDLRGWLFGVRLKDLQGTLTLRRSSMWGVDVRAIKPSPFSPIAISERR